MLEAIVESSGKPYFSFKDLDENKPAGAIKVRVETIHHFLERYQSALSEGHIARRADACRALVL